MAWFSSTGLLFEFVCTTWTSSLAKYDANSPQYCCSRRFDNYMPAGQQFFVSAINFLHLCFSTYFCIDLFLEVLTSIWNGWRTADCHTHSVGEEFTSPDLCWSHQVYHQLPDLIYQQKRHMFQTPRTPFVEKKLPTVLNRDVFFPEAGKVQHHEAIATFGHMMVMLIISPLISNVKRKQRRKSTCSF